MAPATEIATIPLAAGATIEDANSPAGKVWQSSIDTIADQEGFQRAYWGRQVENQSVVDLFIDWDSVDSHHVFKKSTVYGPFIKHLATVIDGDASVYHANFTPHPPSAAVSSTNSPVTEIVTSYFSSYDDGYEEKVNKLLNIIKENAEGFRAASAGWVIEDVEHESIGQGKKGRAFKVVVGWVSVDAHMKFRDSDAFKSNIGLLREGPVGSELHHTVFVER